MLAGCLAGRYSLRGLRRVHLPFRRKVFASSKKPMLRSPPSFAVHTALVFDCSYRVLPCSVSWLLDHARWNGLRLASVVPPFVLRSFGAVLFLPPLSLLLDRETGVLGGQLSLVRSFPLAPGLGPLRFHGIYLLPVCCSLGARIDDTAVGVDDA